MELELQQDQVQDNLALYADDHLGCWTVQSIADLRRALREAEALLNVLAANELDISPEKSAVLVELRGTRAIHVLHDLLCTLPTCKWIRIGRRRLPLKTSHEYLGIVVSFRQFEVSTFQHRKNKAVQTFNRLVHILRNPFAPGFGDVLYGRSSVMDCQPQD